MKLINDLITQLIDPNIFYSRFSFFESGREAINLKYNVSSDEQRTSNSSAILVVLWAWLLYS